MMKKFELIRNRDFLIQLKICIITEYNKLCQRKRILKLKTGYWKRITVNKETRMEGTSYRQQ